MLRNLISQSKRFFLLLLLPLLIACNDTKKEDVFRLTKYVNDNASLFSPTENKELVSTLKNIRDSKKIDVFLVTINDLPEAYNIDNYTNQVFNNTSIGGPTNRGMLLVIVRNLKQYRIEVSRNLEGDFPDQNVNNAVKSAFKGFRMGKWKDGVIASLNELFSKGE